MPDSRPTVPPRIAAIDVLRGVALVAMMVYHFSWDLAYHGFVGWNVAGDPAWRSFAIGIAGSFLALAGVSLVLASRGGLDLRAYLTRLGRIGAAAALVSITTYLVFPETWVFFGILHMIAVGSVLALPFLNAPVSLTVVAGVLVLMAPAYLASPMFDHPLLWFTGLSTFTPASNDFEPVFPWAAPVLFGVALGRLIADGVVQIPAVRVKVGIGRMLATMGRWSLLIYLVHQPVLFGLVAAAGAVLPANPVVERDRFVRACTGQCSLGLEDGGRCAAFCGCVAEAMDGTTFWTVRGGDPTMGSLIATAAASCRAGEPLPVE